VLLSWNLGTLTSWNPRGHSRPVMGQLYLYLNFLEPSGPLQACNGTALPLLCGLKSRPKHSHILNTTFTDCCCILSLLYRLTHPCNMSLMPSHMHPPVCPKWRYADSNSRNEFRAQWHALMLLQNMFVNISYSIPLCLEQVLPNPGSKNLKMNFRAQMGCWVYAGTLQVIRPMWIMMVTDKKFGESLR
jgi:hypothetical protein